MTILATINSEMICVGLGIELSYLPWLNKGIVAGFIVDFKADSGFIKGTPEYFAHEAGWAIGNALQDMS